MAQSWIKKVTNWMKGQGFVPVFTNTGKTYLPCKEGCPNCGFKGAIVFKSEVQDGVYASVCQRCKKKLVRNDNQEQLPLTTTQTASKELKAGGRCHGVTAKGNRCALTAKEGGYCAYHKDQAGTTTQGKLEY